MASPFDGMAAALGSVLGAAVTFIGPTGAAVMAQAIFRETPVEAQEADGRTFWIVAPTLRVPKTLVVGLAAGWIAQPSIASPRQFRVLKVWPSGSPSSTANVICELEDYP